MSFTSPSEQLFFSSSPTNADAGPTEEVENTLIKVQHIDRLDPIFNAIVNSSPDAFFDGFSRRVELIKSRTQAFEVCHVTVFDKVLLALTKNGNDLNTTPAIAYYCEEFLGIPAGISLSRKDETVAHMLQIPSSIVQALTPPLTQRGSVSTARSGSTSPGKEPSDNTSRPFAIIAAETGNEITIRIWRVYETAKDEFYAVTDPTSVEKQEAAKFLRDTAENALQHLARHEADPQLSAELQRALAVAKHTAEILSGGRKRKFDEPSTRSRTTVDRADFDRPRSQGREYRDEYRASERRYSQAERHGNVVFNSHSRALFHSSRYDSHYADRPRRQLVSPELSPRRIDKDSKRYKKNPGRGHSGVPFGYTREVDSYQPLS